MSNSSTFVSPLSVSTLTPPTQKLVQWLGPMLIGGLFASALWGMICVQTFTYFMERPPDRVALTVTVFSLWLLDTFSTILLFYSLYYYMVINFMNPSAIDMFVWSDSVYIFNVALSNFVVRTLFIHKIYLLSKKIWLIVPLFVLSLVALGFGICTSIESFFVESLFFDVKSFSRWIYFYVSSEAASDVTLAVTLSILLYCGRTGVHKTDEVVRILVIYVIYTGVLAAFISVAGTIVYAIMPRKRIHQAFYKCLSKFYLTAYLAMLNARGGLRGQMSDSETIHPSQIRFPQQDSERFATENSIPGKSRQEDNLSSDI